MIKLGCKIFLLTLGLLSAAVLWQHAQLSALALARIDPLPEARELLSAQRYAEAEEYLGFFMEFNYVNQTPEAQGLYAEIQEKRTSWLYQFSKLKEGMLTGTSDEISGLTVGVATDFLIVGDLRDLTLEGIKLARGEETDQVLAALASLGVAASVAQFATGTATVGTGGAASPGFVVSTAAKAGLSATKFARKAGKLPKWLAELVTKSASNPKEARHVLGVMGDVGTVARTRGGLNMLSTTTDAESLARTSSFVKVFGSQSSALYKIGGDAALGLAHRAPELGQDTIKFAATFGKGGLRLLDKVGAAKFVKLTARGSKLIYSGDLVKLLLSLLVKAPSWLLAFFVALGVFVCIPRKLSINRAGKATTVEQSNRDQMNTNV